MSLSISTRFVFLSVLILCHHAHSRFINHVSSYDLISDGVQDSQESACEQTYGFLPCTVAVVGNLFLIIIYGFLIYKAATYLSNGSELLLEILGPGIVGGLFLPMLGALPDTMLILGCSLVALVVLSASFGFLASFGEVSSFPSSS